MTDRTRLKLGLLVFVHVYAGWVLSGYPTIEFVNVVRYALTTGDVVLIAMWLVASRTPIALRFLTFVLGIAGLIVNDAQRSPMPLSDSWYWQFWLPQLAATSLVVTVGLFRPRFKFRWRSDHSGLLDIAATARLRQLQLRQASSLHSAASRLQFSLRQIFYGSTAVALVLVARGPLLERLDLFVDFVMPGLVGLAAIRASLTRRRASIKCAAAILFAAVLGESTWWGVARMHDYSMAIEAMIVMASLLVVRSCGYRLVGSEGCMPMQVAC